MARIAPLSPESLPSDLRPLIDVAKQCMGFLSDDVLTMAKLPPVLESMVEMAPILYTPGSVGLELKGLVTFMASSAAGCYYCSSHQMLASSNNGVSDEKIQAIWEYEGSPLYTDAERTALRLAHHAGLTPNATTDDDFEQLKKHFTEEQILELVAVIAMFGFLNRWNDTLDTRLESQPSVIRAKLGKVGF